MNAEQRFWSQVERVPFSGCWIWTGGVNGKGYGRVRMNGKRGMAHRFAYELATGRKAGALCVCHKCDVPLCINPDHLFLGTQLDNLADMRSKRRHERKLSDENVRAIRQRYTGTRGEQVALAKEFGVTPTMICHVVNGREWANTK